MVCDEGQGPMRARGVTGLRMVQAVWGLPQAAVGACVWAVCSLAEHRAGTRRHRFAYRTAFVREWSLQAGLSLGLFVFVPQGCPRRLLVHEYGHCVQSLVLGPLYVPVVLVPSLVWAGLPFFARWRARHDVSYYAFYPERWANLWGERVCGEPSMAPRR